MKTSNKKIKNRDFQCAMCQARFQVWLDNLNTKEERKEKIGRHLLEYCPSCAKK